MGKQHNKVIKRSRRKAYLKRKKELAKQGVSRKATRTAKAADAEKKAVKKAPVKKATKTAAKKTAAMSTICGQSATGSPGGGYASGCSCL